MSDDGQPPSGRSCFLQRFPSLYVCFGSTGTQARCPDCCSTKVPSSRVSVRDTQLCCATLADVWFSSMDPCGIPCVTAHVCLESVFERGGSSIFFAVLTIPIDVASRPCVRFCRGFFLVGSLDSTRVRKRNIGRACTTGSSQFPWTSSVRDTRNGPMLTAVSHS